MHDDLTRLQPRSDFSRREFVVTSLAAGFAMAAQPVAATDDHDRHQRAGGRRGEDPRRRRRRCPPTGRCRPRADLPVILVVQEIFGVHEHIKDICRRLAKLGYFAVAPELYARQGDVSKIKDFQEILKVVSKVPDAQVMSDLDATVAWAKATGKGDTARLGITGYLLGRADRLAVRGAQPRTSRRASPGTAGCPVRPTSCIPSTRSTWSPRSRPPCSASTARPIRAFPSRRSSKMRAALKEAGKTAEIVLYPDTPHAFFADYRPSYRKEQAEDGWKRMLDWFKKYGVA